MRECVTVSAMVSAGKVSRLPNSRSVAAEAVQGRVQKPMPPLRKCWCFPVLIPKFSGANFRPAECS